MRILCVVPSLPEDLNPACLPSIRSQTVPIQKIMLLTERVRGGVLSQKVSYVINKALAQICLEDFDYLLRVDGDTVLPPDYVEKCLRLKPDLCGDWGYVMLIRISPFIRLMNGRFHLEGDDSYITHKFIADGAKVVKTDVSIVQTRKRPHSVAEVMARGTIYYQLGYEPLHLLFGLRNIGLRTYVLIIAGYFSALIRRKAKFDVANYVWHYQTRI